MDNAEQYELLTWCERTISKHRETWMHRTSGPYWSDLIRFVKLYDLVVELLEENQRLRGSFPNIDRSLIVALKIIKDKLNILEQEWTPLPFSELPPENARVEIRGEANYWYQASLHPLNNPWSNIIITHWRRKKE